MPICIGCGMGYSGRCGCDCAEYLEDSEDYCPECQSAPCRCDEEYDRRRAEREEEE